MYGRHPFYLSPRETQDDRVDRDLLTGERLDGRGRLAECREYVWRWADEQEN